VAPPRFEQGFFIIEAYLEKLTVARGLRAPFSQEPTAGRVFKQANSRH
jgi:hypothetical protein